MRQDWKEICSEISEQCCADGYPSHGSNYELRVEQAHQQFEEQGFLLSDEEVERWNRK
jgi:hypothetical protein